MRRTWMALVLVVACRSGGAPAGAPGASEGTPHAHGEAHGHAHAGPPGGHHVGHRFQDADQWAKVFDDPSRDAWQRPADVVALLELAPGATVADLGAGTGYFMPYLSRAVGTTGAVIAVDVEDDMVRYLGERAAREGLANVRARKAAYDDPGLDPASVDRVLIVDTWHHIADRGAYARKLATALRPGGSVTVVDFTQESEKGPPVKMRVRAEDVIAELTAGGLEAALLPESLPEQFVVVGRKRP